MKKIILTLALSLPSFAFSSDLVCDFSKDLDDGAFQASHNLQMTIESELVVRNTEDITAVEIDSLVLEQVISVDYQDIENHLSVSLLDGENIFNLVVDRKTLTALVQSFDANGNPKDILSFQNCRYQDSL
jgi:hypothetical protein